ncbi:putative serine-threonine protein kinase [Aspergillus desertorum]
MPEETVSCSYGLEFKSFRDWNGDRPSQTLVFHNDGSSWWIKVEIDWSLPESIVKLGYLKRRPLFQESVRAIDFSQLHLLDNTTRENPFLSTANRVSFQIAEDPRRIIYPILDQVQDLPTFEASHLEDAKVIAPTIDTVLFKQERFAYKKLERLIYEPGDTEHILNEIKALAQFRGQPYIAQLIGLVIYGNPYKTRPSTISSPVITGFLLEYYPEGSLEQVLAENKVEDDSLLRRWALQTGRALEVLHTQQLTHLDIKPSNIVLDANRNAILIDISGTGGAAAPASSSFDERVATDCWAYGRLLLTMAKKIGTTSFGKRLQSIGADLTRTDPKARISLSDALERI